MGIHPCQGDYDGDGKTDFAVWRPGNQNIYILPSSNPQHPYSLQVPSPTSILSTKFKILGYPAGVYFRVDGFWDNDGLIDFGVWSPSSGNRIVITTDTPGLPMVQQWGLPGDVPVQSDYDGDGLVDFGVWRPSNGTFYYMSSYDGTIGQRQWGVPGDIPAVSDYDGDGVADLAVWRPSEGNWYFLYSSSGLTNVQQWGVAGDVPVPGDYDGDGIADFAVWRPADGNWLVIPSSDPTNPYSLPWGLFGDNPVPGDFDGNGVVDFAVVRPPAKSLWLALNDGSGNYCVDQLGLTGSVEISYSTTLNALPAIKKIEKKGNPEALGKGQRNSRSPPGRL